MIQYVNIVFVISVLMSIQIQGMPTENGEEGSERHLLKRSALSEREVANRLLSRLLDVAYETFKDLGVSSEELQQVNHKRSRIAACYFQAVTCY